MFLPKPCLLVEIAMISLYRYLAASLAVQLPGQSFAPSLRVWENARMDSKNMAVLAAREPGSPGI